MNSVARTTHRDRLPSSSRYQLLVKIASGGMASVYVGRRTGAVGFQRLVAIKRAHAHLIEDASFRRSFIAEARLASKIHHPNVVGVEDVEELEGELLLVMEYVEGASLFELSSAAAESEHLLTAPLAVRILLDACEGLHAAHELVDDDGQPLGLVHRDVSPHNILVGIDGVARIADFGIAKSAFPASANTATGALKGKVSYMAPEYIDSGRVDVRSDVFALGVVAWETLTRQRLFRGMNEIDTMQLLRSRAAPRPSSVASWLSRDLDEVVLKALEKDPDERWQSVRAFGEALQEQARDRVGSRSEVAEHVRALVQETLIERRALVRAKQPKETVSSDDEEDRGPTETLRESPQAKTPRKAHRGGIGVAAAIVTVGAAAWLMRERPAELESFPQPSIMVTAVPEAPPPEVPEAPQPEPKVSQPRPRQSHAQPSAAPSLSAPATAPSNPYGP
ncbi:MAG TPA: serine/threonine-protein kinase [Polyangiaceae bacterium]|jgi:serine/threonine-protein kinase|nr:serine/threonine-protein kinase [Polyangiaceae bacterium]